MSHRLVSLRTEPLEVPLREPFVLATARVDVTPAVLVVAEVEDASGRRATGLGEAACLPPVTRETPFSVEAALASFSLGGMFTLEMLPSRLVEALPERPVARAGVETAILDALGRLAGVPVWRLLGGALEAPAIESDVTIPIGDSESMARLAMGWRAKGFRSFKVKVGRNVDLDALALEAIHRAVPDATYRLDANANYTVADTLALARACDRLGLVVECWEQPCGRLALEAMAEVTARLEAPVVADESVGSIEDLRRVIAAKAADGVNLKLVKSGGPLSALAIGRAAREAGMPLMVGEMVETRLGTTAALHVACALGGVEWPDLDTAWLLAGDPFSGGYTSDGPVLRATGTAGLGVEKA